MAKSIHPSSARALFDLEQLHAANGTLPAEENPFLASFIAHFQQWNAKQSEALALCHESHPIVQLRTLLFRGRIQEAGEILKHAMQANLGPNELSEILMERARIAVMSGDWRQTLEYAEIAAQGDLIPLSKLSLFQIQALAYFESGELLKALHCLEKVDSLAQLFPNCSAVFYAGILRIRIAARLESPQAAWGRIEELWIKLRDQGQLSQNHAQTLLRAEIDLCRLQNRPTFARALASLLISEAMGERLYAALAAVDCYYSENPSAKEKFRLDAARSEFARVDRLVNEIENENIDQSLSAMTVRNYAPQALHPPDSVINPQTIILAGPKVTIDLATGKVNSAAKYEQLIEASKAIAREPLNKERFFKSLWGTQKYVPELHDGLIFGVQQRLKSKLGIKLSVSNTALKLDQVLVVCD